MIELTEEQACELSVFAPNLACVIWREPPKKSEETREAARAELAGIMNMLQQARTTVTQDREEYAGRFALSDTEREKSDKFARKHAYGCGGRDDFTIRFTATGVGIRKTIKCKGCGKKRDISEYEAW